VYGGKAVGLTFTGESSFDLNEPFMSSSSKLQSTTADAVAKDNSTLSSRQRPSLPPTIVAHCSGLASPPDSDKEEFGCNSMLGVAAFEVMSRFNERTVLSVGTTQAATVYQREIFRLACSVSNGKRRSVRTCSLTVSSIHS
jgi:hypothetical protein